jgi:GTP-binding protein
VFADRVRIEVEGGRGGNGAISFRREKFVPKGGPDGGDGGHGGNVVAVADAERRDLGQFRGKRRFRATRGRHGEGSNRRGADGEDVALGVPVGTQVLDSDGGLVADLAHPGARVVVARGGRGGLGNRRFASAARQVPRVAEPGLPGESATIELHLKLLADAALLGFPNAGKSSILRRISNATPRVAEYPFTTIVPVLGTVEAPDGRQLVVADVPGLLEGASRGVGLGDEFLAHLERARVLIHVLDGQEEDLVDRFRTIDRELRAYGATLAERPQIVVLNKVDLHPAATLDVADDRILAVVHTSALTGQGIEELKRVLFDLIPEQLQHPAGMPQELADYLVYRPRATHARAFRVLRAERGYIVTGRNLETVPRQEIDEALREAGARTGDEVRIGDEEFVFATAPPARSPQSRVRSRR